MDSTREQKNEKYDLKEKLDSFKKVYAENNKKRKYKLKKPIKSNFFFF